MRIIFTSLLAFFLFVLPLSAQINMQTDVRGNSAPVEEFLTTPRPVLKTWLNALHNCDHQVCNVVLFGDSFTRCEAENCGTNPVYGELYADRLAASLKAIYGDHGTGIIPFIYAVPAGVDPMYYTVTGGTYDLTGDIGPFQASSNRSGIIDFANGTTWTFDPSITRKNFAYDGVTIYCATRSSTGSLSVDVDGVVLGTACGTTTSSPTAHAVHFTFPLGIHKITGTSTGVSVMYGVEATIGTTGVSVHNLAVGSTAAEFYAPASTKLAFSDLIPGGTHLFTIMEGYNEPCNACADGQNEFEGELTDIITHERALSPSPSAVILVQPITNDPGQTPYSAVAIKVQRAMSTGSVNPQDRNGQAARSDFFVGPDSVHPTAAGHGDIASQLVPALLDYYRQPTMSCAAYGPNYFMTGMSGGTPTCAQLPNTCGSGYSHWVQLTTTTVGSTLSAFPILLPFNGSSPNSITYAPLKYTGSGGHVVSGSGTDITFCSASSGGQTLSYEMVRGSYVPTTGAVEFYAKSNVPTGGANVFMFYGKANASDQSNSKDVWFNGYLSVVHFRGASGTSTLDLTDSVTGSSFANFAAGPVAGLFGQALNAPATTYIYNTSASNPSGSAPWTMDVWFKLASSLPANDNVLLSLGQFGSATPLLDYHNDGSHRLSLSTSGEAETYTWTADTSWHNIQLVNPASGGSLSTSLMYFDGTPETLTCTAGTCVTAWNIASPSTFFINVSAPIGVTSSATYDEVRLSSVGRSSDWVRAQVANQTNPSTWLTVGSEN